MGRHRAGAREEGIVAGGWSRDGAVQEQIDASVEDAVNRARSALAGGRSLPECESCGAAIPQARREAVPGVTRCVACQEAAESRPQAVGSLNRRASKDSLLR
jgi:phage/conjugal plasmid C-4 type zinc finger TraR family protein